MKSKFYSYFGFLIDIRHVCNAQKSQQQQFSIDDYNDQITFFYIAAIFYFATYVLRITSP